MSDQDDIGVDLDEVIDTALGLLALAAGVVGVVFLLGLAVLTWQVVL